jgi:hypothetical protein
VLLHAPGSCAADNVKCYMHMLQAFESAGDVINVVRICLDKLNQPAKAYTLVRKSKSSEAATVVAKYCLQNSNFQVIPGTIQSASLLMFHHFSGRRIAPWVMVDGLLQSNKHLHPASIYLGTKPKLMTIAKTHLSLPHHLTQQDTYS